MALDEERGWHAHRLASGCLALCCGRRRRSAEGKLRKNCLLHILRLPFIDIRHSGSELGVLGRVSGIG